MDCFSGACTASVWAILWSCISLHQARTWWILLYLCMGSASKLLIILCTLVAYYFRIIIWTKRSVPVWKKLLHLLVCFRKAATSFGLLWSQHDIKPSTKLGVYRAYIIPALLYACETWVVYRQHFKAFERSLKDLDDKMAVIYTWHCSAWGMPDS